MTKAKVETEKPHPAGEELSRRCAQFAENLVFIVYDPRSGSTFFSRLLAERLGVLCPPDARFVSNLLAAFDTNEFQDETHLAAAMDILRGDRKWLDWGVKPEAVEEGAKALGFPLSLGDLVAVVCDAYRQKVGSAAGLCALKRGQLAYFHQRLREIFPRCRFICIARDGRAVFNSKRRSLHSETGAPMEESVARAARKWREMMALQREILDEYPQDSLLVSYERLIGDTDGQMAEVQEFLLGDRAEAAFGTYDVLDRYANIHANVRKGPQAKRVDAWRDELPPRLLLAYECLAGKALLACGYPLVYPRAARVGGLLARAASALLPARRRAAM